jgi:hypothetical protein
MTDSSVQKIVLRPGGTLCNHFDGARVYFLSLCYPHDSCLSLSGGSRAAFAKPGVPGMNVDECNDSSASFNTTPFVANIRVRHLKP